MTELFLYLLNVKLKTKELPFHNPNSEELLYIFTHLS